MSYIVTEGARIDLAAALEVLAEEFGVRRLLLEGGAAINGGLVDEVHLLVAPAFGGGADVQGIVALDGGLAGKVELSLRGAEMIEHGLVHLSYAVMQD